MAQNASVRGHTPSGRRSRPARRRRGPLRVLGIFLTAVLIFGLGVFGVVTTLSTWRPDMPVAQRCAAQIDGTSWFLSPEQAQNAALFAATAAERGLPARAVTIAIATALQESKMINIDYGDRDSIGLFQQRPSQGWGSIEEIMDPVYSTGAFYDGLVKVRGFQDLEITVAAQAVQRSGFPDAYAQHEGRSRAWASALTGHSPAALSCVLPEPARATDPADPTGRFMTRLGRDLPSLATGAGSAGTDGASGQSGPSGNSGPSEDGTSDSVSPVVILDSATSSAEPSTLTRTSWATAQWAVAVSDDQDIVLVEVADQVWRRSDGQWHENASLAPGKVRITLEPPALRRPSGKP